ncbi:histone-lysine N-methyltransferase CLF [Artemisia annua]|uniref:Histone-lysine N-methyltransferase CLF n=1 Tax=Artemisia annua TaxID=35608 RepID=A0A2U1QGS5_ARTAN|nr:histone-lysine N-methyltransferase CLF [Artemisia annua]
MTPPAKLPDAAMEFLFLLLRFNCLAKEAALQEATTNLSKVSLVIDSLKKTIDDDHVLSIKERMENNRIKMAEMTKNQQKLSEERGKSGIKNGGETVNLLQKRMKEAIDLQNGVDISLEDKHAPVVLLQSGIPVKKSIIPPIILPKVGNIPPYTTWIFLDRNQKMTEDQSIVGRRRIYYDQDDGEALLCSDSEEEIVDEEENIKEFVEAEDKIIRMTIKQLGSSDVVYDSLAQRMSRKPCEVKARYEALVSQHNDIESSKSGHADLNMSSSLEKDLEAAQDSFDHLFCRRCLIFDCKLHGCSQELIFPAEKQRPWNAVEEDNIPCGPHCYLKVPKLDGNAKTSPLQPDIEQKTTLSSDANEILVSREKDSGPSPRKSLSSYKSDHASSNGKNISESSDSEIKTVHDATPTHSSPSTPKDISVGKCEPHHRNSNSITNDVTLPVKKRQRNMASESEILGSRSDSEIKTVHDATPTRSSPSTPKDISVGKCEPHHRNSNSITNDVTLPVKKRQRNMASESEILGSRSEEANASSPKLISYTRSSRRKDSSVPIGEQLTTGTDDTQKKNEFGDEGTLKQVADFESWKTFEKSLFEKGIEMFGKNSCLIARNLMGDLKTCLEVHNALEHFEKKLSAQGIGNSQDDGCDTQSNKGLAQTGSKFMRRKGKTRRLKYTRKSGVFHYMRKHISDKDLPCHQYDPCGCQSSCGDDCPCLASETCCEKYCGCPRTCKIKFRGCNCAKSQCRSRQCDCFAANRECDPDVCRNCWTSCGDGTLETPVQKDDNHECKNMKLLLRQKQRCMSVCTNGVCNNFDSQVLLGTSDVSGDSFVVPIQNDVAKQEYIGEYTGELVSHYEADKRGKIYDRENSSYLFNLNNQYVVDAYRKGGKLKFVNHSPNPNCHAKVMMVGGDHRVGIYAKERISAGEELFFDYRYEADRAPAWAKKPGESHSKREDTTGPSRGQAKKLA